MSNRFALLEEHLSQDERTPAGRLRRGLLAQLRDANVTIDLLWRSALADHEEDIALSLAEASHAVHRALIALDAGD